MKGFDDPFAITFLPDDCRSTVERRLRGGFPRSRCDAVLGFVAEATERLMGPRTLEIDDGLRKMAPGYQLVILGAGLDARAYRMKELRESVAFEVDHPASQAFKRSKTAGLTPQARALHHVAVDFERESFADALERAGHDAAKPTAWIFEGVISYLHPRDVEVSLDRIAKRSASGSRLFATYNEPSAWRRLAIGPTLRKREPPRATFRRREMHALLTSRGFVVSSDRDGLERATRFRGTPSATDRIWARFHHVVIADVNP